MPLPTLDCLFGTPFGNFPCRLQGSTRVSSRPKGLLSTYFGGLSVGKHCLLHNVLNYWTNGGYLFNVIVLFS